MSSTVTSREIAPGLVLVEKQLPTGWGLNMLLVSLREGLLVHSPTWLGPETFATIEAYGTPRVLFAPNHFHHLSLARYRARYPDAIATAGERAVPRLTRQGHAALAPLDAAARLLPDGAAFRSCEGARSGETWLSLPTPAGPTWLASDAFFNVERPVSGATGLALRGLGITPGLRIGQTFPWLALDDRRAYKAWALDAIERERPRRLVVSHGAPVEGADLPARLARLVDARL